jgi:hypothetical protein
LRREPSSLVSLSSLRLFWPKLAQTSNHGAGLSHGAEDTPSSTVTMCLVRVGIATGAGILTEGRNTEGAGVGYSILGCLSRLCAARGQARTQLAYYDAPLFALAKMVL